jgi:hypothetical protein
MFLFALSVQTGLHAQAPLPRVAEPANKRDVARFAEPSNISRPGFFVYSSPEGIRLSSMQSFKPALVPNTGPNPGNVRISQDGAWLLFSTSREVFLIRPDGSDKTEVPIPSPTRPEGAPKSATFVYNGPFGDEIAFVEEDRVISAMRVDLSGRTPRFGESRRVVDFTDAGDHIRWNDNPEQRLTLAADRVFVSRAGWAGSVDHHFITVPDGGRGVARSFDDAYKRTQTPKWECGSAMSWCGRIALQNPGGSVPKENYPVEIGHKGFVVFPFMAPGDPPLSTHQLYDQRSLAVAWVPEPVRLEKGDWHHWCFSNDPAYVIGTNQGERGLRGNAADYKAIGIYIVHWPTGTYHRVSDEGVRAEWMGAFFPENPAQMALWARAAGGPPPAVAAGAVPQSAAPKPAENPPFLVEATAVELSPNPKAEDLQVYAHVARFIRYRVHRANNPDFKDEHIVIGHWSAYDRAFTPASTIQAGDKLWIQVEKLGDQNEITLAQTMDTLEDFEAERHWALNIRLIERASTPPKIQTPKP